jgi:hypothetical protein
MSLVAETQSYSVDGYQVSVRFRDEGTIDIVVRDDNLMVLYGIEMHRLSHVNAKVY